MSFCFGIELMLSIGRISGLLPQIVVKNRPPGPNGGGRGEPLTNLYRLVVVRVGRRAQERRRAFVEFGQRRVT